MKARGRVLEKVQRRRRRKKQLLIGSLAAGLVLILAAAGWLTRSDHFLISQIEVSGVTATSPAALQTAAAAALAGDYFWLVPRRQILFFSRAAITAAVFKQSARIKSLKIRRTGLKSISLQAVERAPAALICAESCYFADDTGFIFSSAPAFSRPVFLVWQVGTATALKLGSQIIERPAFSLIRATANLLDRVLESRGFSAWQAVSVTSLDGGDYQVLLAESGREVELPVLINANNSAAELAHNFDVALGYLLGSTTPSVWPPLKYIDLRFGKKVFYKL